MRLRLRLGLRLGLWSRLRYRWGRLCAAQAQQCTSIKPAGALADTMPCGSMLHVLRLSSMSETKALERMQPKYRFGDALSGGWREWEGGLWWWYRGNWWEYDHEMAVWIRQYATMYRDYGDIWIDTAPLRYFKERGCTTKSALASALGEGIANMIAGKDGYINPFDLRKETTMYNSPIWEDLWQSQ